MIVYHDPKQVVRLGLQGEKNWRKSKMIFELVRQQLIEKASSRKYLFACYKKLSSKSCHIRFDQYKRCEIV